MKRRRVWRVGAWYGSVAVGAALAIDQLAELPSFAIVLLAVGFPVALVVAWLAERRAPAELTAPAELDSLPADARQSIVVLPFDNLSPEEADAYLADGLTEEVIADLSAIQALRVISRSSAMRLKGSQTSPVELGRRLGVDFVIEGSVRKAGGDVRINVRMVEVASDDTRWTERYSGSLEEVLDIQERVARSVSSQLAVELSEDEADALSDRPIEDPMALESYLRARYAMWTFSQDGLRNAVRHLRNGLDVVGDNALLWSTLGMVYTWHAQVGLDADGGKLREAQLCADKLTELEPDSPRTDALKAWVQFHGGDLRGTRAPLERAFKAMPNDPDTVLHLGYLCALVGQHTRALELFEHLTEIDPLTPLNHAMPGFVAVLEGRPADAVPSYRRAYEMDPDNPFLLWCMVWVLVHGDQVSDADPFVRELGEKHSGSVFAALAKAQYLAAKGEREEALASITDDLLASGKQTELFSRELTRSYSLAGETSEALDWLENTIRIGNVNYPFWSRHDRVLEPIRGEPRFAELMETVRREWLALNPDRAAENQEAT